MGEGKNFPNGTAVAVENEVSPDSNLADCAYSSNRACSFNIEFHAVCRGAGALLQEDMRGRDGETDSLVGQRRG